MKIFNFNVSKQANFGDVVGKITVDSFVNGDFSSQIKEGDKVELVLRVNGVEVNSVFCNLGGIAPDVTVNINGNNCSIQDLKVVLAHKVRVKSPLVERVSTSSGPVKVVGNIVEAKTASGSITVEGNCTGNLKTASGNISVKNAKFD